MRRVVRFVLSRLLSVALSGLCAAFAGGEARAAARADAALAGGDDASRCLAAIDAESAARGLPRGLLGAIGGAESGRWDPVRRRLAPWPWTVNNAGNGRYFDSAAEAIAWVRELRGQGRRNIDVGCMQINLMHHPDAFGSLEAAFDPRTNVAYGADFLTTLADATGSWQRAIQRYHSADPERGRAYGERVASRWNRGEGGGPPGAGLPRRVGPRSIAAARTGSDGKLPWQFLLPGFGQGRTVASEPARRFGSLAGRPRLAPPPRTAPLAQAADPRAAVGPHQAALTPRAHAAPSTARQARALAAPGGVRAGAASSPPGRFFVVSRGARSGLRLSARAATAQALAARPGPRAPRAVEVAVGRASGPPLAAAPSGLVGGGFRLGAGASAPRPGRIGLGAVASASAAP